MEEIDYEKKKKKERFYIKFSFYVLLSCAIIAPIWALLNYQHKVKILQYGENAYGVVIGKSYGKTSKKSVTPSYYIRFECFIDSVRYNMIENISKEGYDTTQIGQIYVVKYLFGKNPIYNSMILFNKPVTSNISNHFLGTNSQLQ